MAKRPVARPPIEVIPSVEGGVSALGSAQAPFVYFEGISAWGVIPGVIRITLEAGRLLPTPDGKVAVDRVVVGHLRMNEPAARSLADALQKALLALTPVSQRAQN
jgi:hypothetical protein